MNIVATIVAVGTFLYLVVTSLVVWLKNSRSFVNTYLAIALLFISLWLLGVAGLTTGLGKDVLYSRLVFLAPAAAMQALYLFVYYFVQSIGIKIKWFLDTTAANVAGLIMAMLTLATPLIVKSVMVSGAGQLPTPLYGRLYLLYILWLVVLVVSLAVLLFRAYSLSRYRQRRQIQAVALGLLLAVAVGFLTDIILPPIFHTHNTAKLSPVSAIVLAFFLSYAVLKHHFLDIRLLAVRALSYMLSIFGLGLMYGIATFLVITGLLRAQVPSTAQRAIYAALAVGLAFLFQPVIRFFNKLTRQLFYRSAYDPQEVLDRASSLIVGSVKPENLSQSVIGLLNDTFHPERSALLTVAGHLTFLGSNYEPLPRAQLTALHSDLKQVRGQVVITDKIEDVGLRNRLHDRGISVAVPLHAHQDTVGYLIFGDKLSGSPYDRQDTRLLSIIADSLAIAIQNALRFDEIERFNQTLQEKIEKATHQLRTANDRLRALDATKDDFISMASHQLRTPLTSAKGYLSMVLDGDAGKITATQRKLLGQSFSSAQRMVYIVSDLLNLSRLKTGRFVIEATPTNLPQIVADEIDQLRDSAALHQLDLQFDKPANFPLVTLDETKTRQVIMNFIDNAIFYTPSGGHIVVKLVDKPSSIEFTVTDDGIGVPASERHRLFTKFYRASNARKTRPDGTGLGLFMAKKIIVAQSGALIFTSHEGRGSTFGFSLPKKVIEK